MQSLDYARAVTESFALPDACTRIREMLDDDYSTIDDIADVIAIDPSLSASLLKLANSALYNFPKKVTTISKAVNVIGGDAVYSLVMTETASTVYKQFDDASINLERYWQQAVFTSLIARELARLCGSRQSECLFLIGLLSNFGELSVARHTPAIAERAEQYHAKQTPWQLQQQLLGFSYADISVDILREWDLPEAIYLPIQQSFQLGKVMDSRDAAIIYASIRAALTLVHPEKYSISSLINLELLKTQHIDEEKLLDAISFARQEATSILFLMNPDLFLIV